MGLTLWITLLIAWCFFVYAILPKRLGVHPAPRQPSIWRRSTLWVYERMLTLRLTLNGWAQDACIVMGDIFVLRARRLRLNAEVIRVRITDCELGRRKV